ncbi:caspase family protein [Alkalinema sp. FACHB-956]|uniref:caspase family protein n=1 Tax=Alkalinema sp. FACHB-956 TaxID=2692768 RepID=UPI0016824E35|nr:caspase family protein [Alkalinema sp. FACHB-956]MBD2329110.1 caspase family protein [Alkalinema sp. FACHB-956]
MNKLRRRHFLQFSGATLASIGLSQWDFLAQAQRHNQVLAQATGRKYALLIGINQYADPKINNLQGCLSDVAMQYNLLRYRYGFAPENIRILTDETPEKPTRANILRAFEEHLIAQVKPGDIAIFHYSGHGGLMRDPHPIDPKNPINGTLIPMDCSLDNRNDIMGRTIFLLSKQIQTDAFTMVLDSCHSGGGTRGNSTVRALRVSRSDEPIANPSREELAYQKGQREKLGLSEAELTKLRRAGIAKGVAIGSAKKEQLAVDAKFAGFHAGALTYLLTRYLWQNPTAEPLQDTFGRLALITREVAADSNNPQEPIKEVAPGKRFDAQPVYQIKADRPNAEGVVTKVTEKVTENQPIEFWLGGVSSNSLEAYQPGSLFSVLDNQGKVVGEIEQTGLAGLVGYGVLKQGDRPQVGSLLREKLRQIPSDRPLQVALSPEIIANRAELQAELAKVSNLQIVEVEKLSSGGVIIGPLTADIRQEASTRGMTISQPPGSIGLLTATEGAIAGSFGKLDESPQSIVNRLRPQLKSLLARQFLQSVLNGNTSQLKVDVALKKETGEDIQVLAKANSRSLHTRQPAKPLKAGSEFTIHVTNQESVPIYMAAISIGDTGELVILHPIDWTSPESAALVEKGKTAKAEIEIEESPGFFEIVVVTSARPLRDMLRGLQQIAAARGISGRSVLPFDQGSRSAGESDDTVVESARNLTRDLTRGFRPKTGAAERRGLDPQQSGVFSTVLQVVR